MNPFDITNQVSSSTQNNWEEIGDKDYVPFMINRALSYHLDTVMLSNEMNMRHTIPKQWQYDFYRIAIQPKKKRFSKWAKPEEDKLIELVSKHYQVTRRKAIAMVALMKPEDIALIKEVTDTGGR